MKTPRTVLHVEDNFDNRLLVRRLLQSEGYTVLEAENAKQALDQLNSTHPDLILIDINMPDMDGYTLTHQIKIRQEFASTPVVAITANVMKGDREKTLNAGCDGYLEKPINVDTFLDQIKRYIY
jgi:two-component system cell cycle response regulator DivK